MPNAKREYSIPEQHQRRIAAQTLKMNCVMARIMGGMDHIDAARILQKPIPQDCHCKETPHA